MVFYHLLVGVSSPVNYRCRIQNGGGCFCCFTWGIFLQEITIARQKEYLSGLKNDSETDKKEKEEVGSQPGWIKQTLG